MSSLDALLIELKAIDVVALVDCDYGQFAILDNSKNGRSYTSPPVVDYGNCESCSFYCQNVERTLVDRLYDYYDRGALITYLERMSGEICAGSGHVSPDECQNGDIGDEQHFNPLWYALAVDEDGLWRIGYCRIDGDRAFLHRFAYCPNTYDNGRICWGNNDIPQGLINAFFVFWESRFNEDLGDAIPSSFPYDFGRILGVFWITDPNPDFQSQLFQLLESLQQFPRIPPAGLSQLDLLVL